MTRTSVTPDAPPATPRASWTREHVARIATQSGAALPRLAPHRTPILPGMDVWDMWQIADAEGGTSRRAKVWDVQLR